MAKDDTQAEGEFYHRDIFGLVVDVDLSEEEVSEEVKAAGAGRGDFNSFAFTDAVGERKKRDAWVLCQKALASGQAPEQLFYKLMWLCKTMLLASRTTVEESKLNPFVYRKSKGFLKNFKDGEVEQLSRSLIEGYHKARRGEGEVGTMLEKILLSL